ncbi:PREDICTED: rab11 family-interacting protein 2 [Dinoponera quadriceps]|uniref:Rab11 family-interacting protein 2 n=1 Tax=Dinoponera quadriceps TaxID=609295 RepID=A0A6P3Y3A9_DINQU|nr:PREDICTED: rab11 family-interacting protein 2 [Dinoponera quadriceps]
MWSPTHVQVTVQRAKDLLTKGKHKTNDCFVTIALGKEKYQTSVKEKAVKDVEWHEECELLIPEQGNTAEIVLTALHRNFLGVDEFLGTVSIPLSSFDVYERPRNRWYALNSKPGKENTKERGELEVRIGFIVKAGSLTDLTRKERHKSSLGQLSTAAQSIGGSLLSIGSLEKRKGLKKLAKSIGNKVKGKSKNRLDVDNLDEKEEHQFTRITRQEPGEADPGVISEDEDEFTFDDLSHKSSASSLNAPVPGVNGGSTNGIGIPNGSQSNVSSEVHHTPPVPVNAAPNKPPRFVMSASTTNLSKVGSAKDDEWGLKLYGKQASSVPKRWENKPSPKIVVNEPQDNKHDASPARSPSPAFRLKEPPEPPSPAPREILQPKNKDEKFASSKEKLLKEDKLRDKKDDKLGTRSPKEEKHAKKDKKRDKENKFNDENHLSSERIIIGGEDAVKNAANSKSRLPHEVLNQFDGKSREDLIELALHLQAQITEKNKRLTDLEDYIDALLLRVIECSPRLLQNPYMSQRRLSSPGHQ